MATTADDLRQEANVAYADAKQIADDSLLQAENSVVAAQAAANGISVINYISGAAPPTGVVPSDVPQPAITLTDFSTDVRTAFDYAFGTFNQTAQGQILNFITTFFPDIAAGVKTGSDQWIIDTIANGSFMPAAVETAIWNRAKDREVQDALRAEQAVIDAGAARGFTTPPGVVTDTVAMTQIELSKKLASINRDIAIKAFDTANENTKFAIQQAVALRTAFVAALGDFIKTAMVQPNNAVEYAKVILASKTGLYDSLIKLYSAQIDEEKLRSTVALENNANQLKAQDIDRAAWADYRTAQMNKAKIQADAAMSAAELLAQVASGAMATRNTMINVSAGV